MNVVIPFDSLKAQTLRAVIEEFITRNGAVHGHVDTPLDRQVEAVRTQLASGKAMIVFDDETGNCSIFLAKDWRKATAEQRDDEPTDESEER